MEHHNLPKGYGKIYDERDWSWSNAESHSRPSSRRPRQKAHWPFQSVVTTHSVMSVWSSADGAMPQARPGAAVPIDVRVTEPAVARVAPRRARWHSRSLMSFSFSLRSSNTDASDMFGGGADDDSSTLRSLVPDYIVNYLRGDTPETVARRQAERRRADFDAHIRALGPTPTSPGWSEHDEEEEKMRARQLLLEKRKWWQWPRQPQLPQHPLLAPERSDGCGWRAGVALFAVLAAVLTLAGLALLVLALRSAGHVSTSSDIRILLGLRAVLAVVAAIDLAAAQYVWQAVGSSVTRAEVDAAHARHQWLDLGLPSVRNALHLLRHGDIQGRGRVLTALVIVACLALGSALLCGSMLVVVVDNTSSSDVSSLFVHTPVLIALIAIHGVTALGLAALLLATRARCLRDRHTPLVTLGDAITSFLRDSDPTTRGACMLSKAEVWRWQQQQDENTSDIPLTASHRPLPPPLFHPVVCQADAPSARWFRAASPLRWLISGLVWFTLVGLAVAALVITIHSSSSSSSSSVAAVLGSFGQFSLDQAIYTRHSITSWVSSWSSISTSLLAALPQLGLAILFLIAHAHLCVYFLSHESALFAAASTTADNGIRRPLRVSTRPHGFQTTSLYLTLPLSWSCLLMLLYAGQHFVLSNSVIATVLQSSSSMIIGFSGLGLVVVLGLLVALGLLVLGLACRCSPSAAPNVFAGNPLALPGGSCSAVISARCHPLTDETTEIADAMSHMMTRAVTPAMTISDAATATTPATAGSHGDTLPLWLRPLAWGPVPGRRPSGSDTDQSDDIGHCTYSSRPLLPLDASRSYA